MTKEMYLRDLGERRIVNELIVPRFGNPSAGVFGIGDDCAVLPPNSPDEVLVWTADPCPTPVQCILDGPDMTIYGRFTALINMSDLAAMGAKPLGLLVSTVMPEDMTISEYVLFLDGLKAACDEWSCPVLGGNIKDGPEFTANGSALGKMQKDLVMRRRGAKPEDRVCVIGEMGLFWAAVLARLFNVTDLDSDDVETMERALCKPIPRLEEGQLLAKSLCVTSCMDSSDGVIGCLRELAIVNNLDFVIETGLLNPPAAVAKVARIVDFDFRKMMLSWGDWNLVCTIMPDKLLQAKACVEDIGAKFTEIGVVRLGSGRVLLLDDGREKMMSNYSSERFSSSSFFTHGFNSYVDQFKSIPLTD